MTNYARFVSEDRRLVVLRVLAEMPAYRTNSFLLHTLLQQWGHDPSVDQVKGDIAWLQEQQLLTYEDVEGVFVVTLTTRGADVAAGRAVVPGVKRPGA
ncbi:ArsR family transcriptional regulator [Variovorax sp.]|uniref:VpaChn25_0724 family phage protein n=1 Tax=Variovorax sp. TaxID=1871043 RepID=UPI003BA9F7BA